MKLVDRFPDCKLIGEGVSARVFKATDTRTGTVVAVKVLNRNLSTNLISVERFRRELQITRSLSHPCIVPVYDVLDLEGELCLVMEFIEGRNLKDHTLMHAPLASNEALAITRQVLEVLDTCHRSGVVHRDLKPQNLMIDRWGGVRVLDFGLAHMSALTDLTQTGTTLGSPEYMAPELFSVNVTDPRCDLYSVGIILFEMLAGRLPFAGDSLPELCQQHLSAPIPCLGEVRGDLSDWIQSFLNRLLAKNAWRRYQSARDALTNLAEARVPATELPSIACSPCARCGNETPALGSICLHCGFSPLPIGETKTDVVDLYCAPGTKNDALRDALRHILAFDPPRLEGKGPLLAEGLPAATARFLVAEAAHRDISLTARPLSLLRPMRKWGAAILFIFLCAFLALVTTHSDDTFDLLRVFVFRGHLPSLDLTPPLDRSLSPGLKATARAFQLLATAAVVTIPLALSYFLIRAHASQIPRVAGIRERLRSRMRLRDRAWLVELQPFLSSERPRDVRESIVEMACRVISLFRARPLLPAEHAVRLRQLVVEAARATRHLSAKAVDETERKLLAANHECARIERDLFCAEGEQRERLIARQDELVAHTMRLFDKESRSNAIRDRLASCQSALDELTGRILAEDLANVRAATNSFAERVEVLRKEIDSQRTAARELGE